MSVQQHLIRPAERRVREGRAPGVEGISWDVLAPDRARLTVTFTGGGTTSVETDPHKPGPAIRMVLARILFE